MLTTFLSLPREIRDQIYYETLFTGSVSRVGARAENDLDTWFAGREHLPGYYRPLLHFHNASQLSSTDASRFYNWRHETRVASVPAIFQVGGVVAAEARELYLRFHVLFEMKILEDGEEAIDRWARGMRRADLDTMQKVHVYVHVRHVFEGPADDPLLKQLRDASTFSLDPIDPVFRIELRDGGGEIAVVSTMRFQREVDDRLKAAMGHVFKSRVFERSGDVFTGADLVLAARAVLQAVAGHQGMEMYLTARVNVRDVACVYEYDDLVEAKLSNYGTVLRLHDRWSNVVVRFRRDSVVGAVDEGCVEQGLHAIKLN